MRTADVTAAKVKAAIAAMRRTSSRLDSFPTGRAITKIVLRPQGAASASTPVTTASQALATTNTSVNA